MALRNKFLSPTCPPGLGDVDTYFFFEKIFRSEIRICVTVTYFFEVTSFLVLFTHADCDRRLLRRMALRNKFLSPTCAPDLVDVDTYFFFRKNLSIRYRNMCSIKRCGAGWDLGHSHKANSICNQIVKSHRTTPSKGALFASS